MDMIQQIAGGRRVSHNDHGEPIIVPRVAQDGVLDHIPNHVSTVDNLQITGIAMASITVHDFRFKPIIKHRVSQWLQNNNTSADDDMCLVILVSSQVKSYPECYQRVSDSVHNTTDMQVLATVASLESIVFQLQQSIQIFSVRCRPPATPVPPLPFKNTVRRNLSPEELFVAKMDRLGLSEDRPCLYGMF
jgi:hypothetical protein